MASPESYAPAELIDVWLRRSLRLEGLAWLDEKVRAAALGDRRGFLLAFGMAPRRLGKADLDLSAGDLDAAGSARPAWRPIGWSVAQAARTRLLLALPADDPAALVALLDEVFASADVAELVALYSALPLLPHPEAHARRAAEGVRNNIKAVFLAVAHGNPYPSERLDEAAWNQLVLKCLFVGASLDPIVGLDLRSNPALARMLVDFARERKAAGRPVPPELWRPVGPFADLDAIRELREALTTGPDAQKMAAALALAASAGPIAEEALGLAPELADAARVGAITWRSIAEARDGVDPPENPP